MPSLVRKAFPTSLLKLTIPIAHSTAFNKTRILHRDISAGNVLITEEGTGVLIDWDLSKTVKDDADAKSRQHSRTVSTHSDTCQALSVDRIGMQGTWQFISIMRLLD